MRGIRVFAVAVSAVFALAPPQYTVTTVVAVDSSAALASTVRTDRNASTSD